MYKRPCGPILHTHDHRPRTMSVTAARNVSPPSPGDPPPSSPSPAWKSFWSSLNTAAWLGTVGTAIAFLFTQEVLLITGPVVLPLLALYTSSQRNKIDKATTQQAVEEKVSSALQQMLAVSEESYNDIIDDVEAFLEDMQRQEKKKAEPEKKAMQALASKLSSLEESMRSMQTLSTTLNSNIAAEKSSTMKEIGTMLSMLRRDVGTELQQAAAEDVAALTKVDSRLAVRHRFYMHLSSSSNCC